MQQQLRALFLAQYLNTIPAVTSLCTVIGQYPDIDSYDGSFIYPQVVSDDITNYGNRGPFAREALVSMTIVGPKVLPTGQTYETVIMDIVDVLNDAIVGTTCNGLFEINGFYVDGARQGTTSPVGYTKQRGSKQQNYFITYGA